MTSNNSIDDNIDILWPTAEELDGRDFSSNTDYRVTVYMMPAAESKTGDIEITYYGRYGAGIPEPAWHNRWLKICTLQGKTVGSVALERLQGLSGVFISANACYLGSRFDGGNHWGEWGRDCPDLEEVWCQDGGGIGGLYYWDAGDWFIPGGGSSWSALCSDTAFSPEDLLRDRKLDEKVILAVIDYHQSYADAQDVHVLGIEDAVRDAAVEWGEPRLKLRWWVQQQKWVTPPSGQGQPMMVSYAADSTFGWKRLYDRSDGHEIICQVRWSTLDSDSDTWEPEVCTPSYLEDDWEEVYNSKLDTDELDLSWLEEVL